jgi:hypothetical protein
MVHYAQRPVDFLIDYARHLTHRSGALPSADLSQLLTAALPLWRLLLFTASQWQLEAEVQRQLEAEARRLLVHVLREGIARMRSTTKRLVRDIIGMPYFSSNGALARTIKDLAPER